MQSFDWSTLVTSSLVSGLISLVMNQWFQRRAERRKLKFDCAKLLFGYDASDPSFFVGFNQVPVIFSDNEKVLIAHRLAIKADTYVGQEMADLLTAIAKDLKVSNRVNPDQLRTRYSVSR